MNSDEPINLEPGEPDNNNLLGLTVVKDLVGTQGTAFRRGGDEVRVLMPGFDHARACALAEKMQIGVAEMKLTYKDRELPRVTTSIGVSSTPPDPRDPALDQLADARQTVVKKSGGNRILSQ